MSASSTIPAWQPRFLAALAKTGNVLTAAHRVNISRQNTYLARSTINRKGEARLQALAFAQCWQMALQESFLPLQEALYDRAMHGVERQKPIYYKGKQVGVQKWTVYSDSLLIHLHKSLEAEINRSDALLSNYEADGPSAESLENLIDDLWCQVLDILEPIPKTRPSKATAPESKEPTEQFISPASVSSPVCEDLNTALPDTLKPLIHIMQAQPALAGFVALARGLIPGRSLPAHLVVTAPIPEIFSQSTVSSPPVYQDPSPASLFSSFTSPSPQPNVGAHGDRFSGRAVPCAPLHVLSTLSVSASLPEIFSSPSLASSLAHHLPLQTLLTTCATPFGKLTPNPNP